MSEPYQVRLDANTARELATKGSTIVLLDVPEGTVIGMDQQVSLKFPLLQMHSQSLFQLMFVPHL